MMILLTTYKKISNYTLQLINLRKYLLIYLLLIGFISTFLVSIPWKIAIARIQNPEPQALLVLGGSPNREYFTAQLAHSYPNIPIWVSTGADDAVSRQIFRDNGVDLDRVYLDHRATDTVTNFTSLVDDFERHKIKHLFVITSNYHIPRASAIATIVLGSRGIAFSAISVPEKRAEESSLKTARDTVRALVWIITGYTGASLKPIK